jgi:tetratricopeptide (TPR) repeat protein
VEKSLALDREDTLKKAEKLLRQGRLDAAIVEYVRVVEEQPRDWNTANTLGDLYVRANQSDKAVAQYARIADHFFQDGFYPKAAALYKKILKIAPDDEPAQLHLADISVRLGLMADAKSYLTAVGSRRRARGDTLGANEIVVRLGTVDPADIEARLAGARVLANSGDQHSAALRFRDVYSDLLEKGRAAEALQALREAVRCNPGDREGRAILARTAVAAGDFEAARGYLDRETAGEDPALLVALVDIELRAGQLDQAREILPRLFAIDRELRHKIVELGWVLTDSNPAAAFVCIDAAVDASLSASEFDDAASILQEFVTRIPTHVPALMKLVEICVDGGLEAAMYEAQAQLADAYLSTSQAAEARVIAEDLVAREPWEGAHIERFRRALVMLRVPEPDTVIAERLSGQTPFIATDHFSEPLHGEPSSPPPVAPVAPEPEPEPEPVAEIPAAKPLRPAAPTLVPPPSAPPPGKAKPRDSGEIDLTSALLELQGPASASSVPPTPASAPAAGDLDDVFTGIRREGSRKAAADQSAQHMKLARTYLEMGMLEEAVNALKTASRSPRQRFEAGSVLARLYKEQGDIPAAIEWFERAAQAPAPTTEEGLALLYDLGLTLEEAGETSRALAVFLELQADAGDYRDVPQRADRLARVQTGG